MSDVPEIAGDPLETAERLTTALNIMSKRLDSVRTYGRRSRILIFVTIVSLVLDVALTGIVTVLAYRSTNLADSIRHASISQCDANNAARLQDIAIWNRLLRVSPEGATAAQRQEVAELERLVAVKDTPRDCTTAYGSEQAN